MGLRDMLMNIQTGAEGAQQYNKSAEEYRRQAALQQLAQNVPGYVQQGDIGSIIQGQLQSGDMTGADKAIAQIEKNKAAGSKINQPMTSQEMATLGAPKNVADMLAGKTRAEQDKALSTATQIMSARSREAGVEQRKISNITTANEKYKGEMKDIEGQISNMARAGHTIDVIREQADQPGGIRATKQLSTDIGNSIATALSGKSQLTVSGSDKQEVDTAEKRLRDFKVWLTSNPDSVIPKTMLDQMYLDIKLMKDSYSNQHRINFNAFKEGLDTSLHPRLENRFKSFREGNKLDETTTTHTGADAESVAFANTIQDPILKNHALAAINSPAFQDPKKKEIILAKIKAMTQGK